jgi:TPR repeat protein
MVTRQGLSKVLSPRPSFRLFFFTGLVAVELALLSVRFDAADLTAGYLPLLVGAWGAVSLRFGLAAVADYTDAEVEYAIALYNGDGVTRNQEAAAALFHKAAMKNNPVAQNRLAHILSSGIGAPANPVEATKWHLISRAHGETDIMLDEFVSKLDAETRAAGEKAAKPWLDALKHPPS